MVSITPYCARAISFTGRRCWPALLLFLLAACQPVERDFGITVEDLEARESNDGLMVKVRQKLVLSPEAREALNHGVPLFLEMKLSLRPEGSRRELASALQSFEIRYLPLSDRYQLSGTPALNTSTYPRLRHVLAQLQQVEIRLQQAGLPAGSFELRARSYLAKRRVPPPMRLPAWFSPQWQHDSGWHSQHIVIAASA